LFMLKVHSLKEAEEIIEYGYAGWFTSRVCNKDTPTYVFF